MNSEFTSNPRKELEAQITALLLGELPENEAAALREKIAADPELRQLHTQLGMTIGLVKEAIASPEPADIAAPEGLKLSDGKREKLLASFKVVKAPMPAKEPIRIDFKSWGALAAMVAALMAFVGLLFPALSRKESVAFAARMMPETEFGREPVEELERTRSLTVAAPAMPAQSLAKGRAGSLSTEVVRLQDSLRGEQAKISINGQVPGVRFDSDAERAARPATVNRVDIELPKLEASNSDFVAIHPTDARSSSLGAGTAIGGAFFDQNSTGGRTFAETPPAAAPPSPNFRFGGGGGGIGDGAGRAFYGQAGEAKNLADAAGAPSRPAVLPTSPATLGFGVSAAPANGPQSGQDRFYRQPQGQSTDLYAFDMPAQNKAGEKVQTVTGESLGKNVSVADQVVAQTEVTRGRALGREFEKEVVLQRELSQSETLVARPEEVGALKQDFGGVAVDGLQSLDDAKKVPAKKDQILAERRADPSAKKPESQVTSRTEEFNRERITSATKVQNARTLIENGRMAEAELILKEAVQEDPGQRAAQYYLNTIKENRLSQSASALSASGPNLNAVVLNFEMPGGGGVEPLTGLPAAVAGEPVAAAIDPLTGLPASERKPELEKLRRDVVALQEGRESVARAIVQQKENVGKPDDLLKITPAEPKNLSLMERFRGAERTAEVQFPKRIAQVSKSALVPLEGMNADTVRAADSRGGGSVDSSNVELARSYDVMKSVGEKLGLQQKWSESEGKEFNSAQVAAELQKIVNVEAKENGRLEIKAKGKDNKEAAQIANAVAEAVREKMLSVHRDVPADSVVPILEYELKKQDEALAKKNAELRDLESKTEPLQAKPVVSNAAIPQPEVSTAENAFSTFSLNVSDVSFKLAAASLEKSVMPEAGGIRSEEFINAFDYRDPAAVSAPVAFAWERARYPFAHDRDLLRFSVKTAASGREAGRPLNLVLLLDSSGSMERADRVRIIQECLRVLATQLQAQDKVSVVSFARTPRLWVDGLPGSAAGELVSRVGTVTPEGGTNLEEAMRVGYETAARHFATNGVNRLVLLTDGAANLGDVKPESLKKRVEENRKKGIALDCFGIGWEGLNDDLLEQLSRNGDGRYGFVNTPEAATTEFAQQLAGALKVAASDVKVQVEFNAKRATAYRQIGYAKHQLTKEQFRDNTVDAAEIGAAEAGNALYVVQVNPAGEGPIATVRARFKIPGTNDYREHEWPVNYEGASAPLEQSTATLRLAGAASAFSEWLGASPYAGEVTPDRLLGLMANIPEAFSNDSRPKQLEWMIRQAKSIAGK